MRTECLLEKLNDGVQRCARLSGKNLSLPVLSSILLSADSGYLTLRSTNLEVGMEVKIPAKVDSPGAAAVPAAVFLNFLANIGHDGIANLFLNNGNLSVVSGKAKTLLKCLPHEEFPVLPRIEKDEGEELAVDARAFSLGLRSVGYAASSSDMKPEIASTYIYEKEGVLYLAATDSFRLAEKTILVGSVEPFSPIIVPMRNANELAHALDGRDGQVNILITKNQLSVSMDNLYFTSRLIHGIFPDYRQIMPKSKKTDIVVMKNDFLQALKLCAVFTDKFNRIDININPEEALFEISSKREDVGENSVSVEATLEGEAVTAGFNARYIIDSFQSIAGDSINITFNGSHRPMVLRGVGDDSFTYLVMPLSR